MRTVQLEVKRREGSIKSRLLRRDGLIPAVFYGQGESEISVQVNAREFDRSGLASKGAHLIRFNSADSSLNESIVLIKESQHHPVTGETLHVDFLRVDLAAPITANVALSFAGKPVGVVNGGILQPVVREVEVRALPAVLPESIEVDVSALDIHDVLHAEDLVVGEGVELLFTDNFTVVTVSPPIAEEVVEEEAAELGEGEGEGEGEAEGDAAAAGEGGEKADDS
ncbi:MAG TPA: 50S ribosomal protein L25 [Deltaproteobacteria bacterium]|nr:50S ribosomal protein L25 [Candidatus Binatota bacterium]HIL12361.1 50S ribosomal protein L25 [Deltaproteobacteria bacterium]